MLDKAKISRYRQKKILQCFCEDLTASQTARLLGTNSNTVNRYYKLFRQAIVRYQESLNGGFSGEVELDESYFGRNRHGRRGRGTDKIPVFGILKRNGRVYTQIIRGLSPIKSPQATKKAAVRPPSYAHFIVEKILIL